MAPDILVTCPPMLGEWEQVQQLAEIHGVIVHPAEVVQTLTEEELFKLVPNFDGWIAGDDPVTEEVLQIGMAGRLSALIKWGVGTDNVDLDAVEKLQLSYSNTPGMFSDEVADIAIGYLICLVRQIVNVDQSVRQGQWIKPQGVSLRGKRAALVGMGNIGQQIATRLAAFGIEIIGYDPMVIKSKFQIESWPDKLETCDFLFLSCALNSSTHHLIDTKILNQLKPGTRIINVSRGPLIDEPALIAGLQSGYIGGAALDVFEIEPITAGSPLTLMRQCILGSHNASNTKDAVQATNRKAMTLITNFLDADKNTAQ